MARYLFLGGRMHGEVQDVPDDRREWMVPGYAPHTFYLYGTKTGYPTPMPDPLKYERTVLKHVLFAFDVVVFLLAGEDADRLMRDWIKGRNPGLLEKK